MLETINGIEPRGARRDAPPARRAARRGRRPPGATPRTRPRRSATSTRWLASVTGTGVTVDVRGRRRTPDRPAGVDLAAYRIVQEALTNVLEHAGPANVAGARRPTAPMRSRSRSATTGAAPAAPVSSPGRRPRPLGMRERVAALRRRPSAPGPGRAAGSGCRPRSPTSRIGDRVIRVLVADDQALVRSGFRCCSTQRPRDRGGRRGRQRRRGRRAGPPSTARRRADGHPHAGARRHRGHPPHRRPTPLAGTSVLVLTTFDLDEYVFEACGPAPAGSCSRTPSPRSCSPRSAWWPTARRCSRPGSPALLIAEFAARPEPATESTGDTSAAHRAGARGAGPGRAGPVQRRDRRGALRERGDGEDPRRAGS